MKGTRATEMRLGDGKVSEENSGHLMSIADCPSAVCTKKGKELFTDKLAVVLEVNGNCETLAVCAGETKGETEQKHISSLLKELETV